MMSLYGPLCYDIHLIMLVPGRTKMEVKWNIWSKITQQILLACTLWILDVAYNLACLDAQLLTVLSVWTADHVKTAKTVLVFKEIVNLVVHTPMCLYLSSKPMYHNLLCGKMKHDIMQIIVRVLVYLTATIAQYWNAITTFMYHVYKQSSFTNVN